MFEMNHFTNLVFRGLNQVNMIFFPHNSQSFSMLSVTSPLGTFPKPVSCCDIQETNFNWQLLLLSAVSENSVSKQDDKMRVRQSSGPSNSLLWQLSFTL